MGLGDQILATGLARGAQARGKRIAFGDRRRILWDGNSAEMFRDNPNIAAPGSERDADIEWVGFYKGHRIYNRQEGRRWVWNLDFTPTPGELFFNRNEIRNAGRAGADFIVIEPSVEAWKSSSPNKDWGLAKYQAVADALRADGHRLVQFRYPKSEARLEGVETIQTIGFRDALAILARSKLYIGPEGGLHHGAAAVGRQAVVLFGGFIPPSVTGYPTHANLTGGAEACGSLDPCDHCRQALARIGPDEVVSAAREKL